eukprot:CAMPEP_0171715212 /NCGR_PEP_ID=MMETSP0991-20121206/18745_1 /TAXON_ID=483369 /ORGANISM="non described non described, Strain CCMP2098" /LENGTH=56 /DNA_ID=CAMNT_0012306079 /DNA_START=226 /DNA_END=396 /DNA_ORIENTATION=+
METPQLEGHLPEQKQYDHGDQRPAHAQHTAASQEQLSCECEDQRPAHEQQTATSHE